jgi:hypothetical protein
MSWTRSGAMDRGYLWFALNNSQTDYVELSKVLAHSIKKHNKHNKVCVITNIPMEHELFDVVKVLKRDDSADEEWKLSNEHKAFSLSPFTHTIKLEADMLFTQNTDWWWYHLWQNDQVFSYHCRNYKDQVVKDSAYRKLFRRNTLPDVYNGLHYFRRSVRAKVFFDLCRTITENWKVVRDEILINCHDTQPTTDVVYALANKIQDPMQLYRVEYDWFKFMHNKIHINGIDPSADNDNYLYPIKVGDTLYMGGYQQHRIVHYHNKGFIGDINARIF